MGYYGMGDYYARGGILDVFKGIGKVAGTLFGAATNPVGTITSAVSSFGGGPSSSGAGLPVLRSPGVSGAIARIAPGGSTGYYVDAAGELRKKRRRMNYANSKALTRANRRVDGFVRLARRSLKHTNYKIVSKSAGKSRRSSAPVFVETGPGSVHAR